MCRAFPLPRCSNHARKQLLQAQALHTENPTAGNELKLEQAQRGFLITPAGIAMLTKQGKHQLATQLQERRQNINADAKRYRKFSASLDSVDSRYQGDEKYRPSLTSPVVRKAYIIACIAHNGVDRKSGEPYINHPLRVAKHLESLGYNDEVVAVALLHDTVEDSDLTLEDLRKHGFSARVVSGVDSVTKREGEKYVDTIQRASQHPIGRVVKLADNLDNSSVEQLKPFSPEKRAKQISKYKQPRLTLIIAIRVAQESLELLIPSLGFTDKSYRLRKAHRAS